MSELPDLTRLAVAVNSNPGVYALLLGSGVSRAAEIPTGFEVVADLVRKIAAAEGADCEPEPLRWFRERFGNDAGYSELIENLAPTPAERTALLRGYFEPRESDRGTAARTPTVAHQHIARLMADGAIRIVLTTNFDRLLEDALAAIGEQAIVIATPADAAGAPPLAHTERMIIKLHGDYLDSRLRNTLGELGSYDQELDGLLDRVLDEFGLIVCGWSGDWDTALRDAISRTPTRRYSTYWARRSTPTGATADLIARRQAVEIAIADADRFFEELASVISALREHDSQGAESAAAAVVRLKRALAEPGGTIAARDLLVRETERVYSRIRASGDASPATVEGVVETIAEYDALTATLRELVAVAAYWGGTDLRRTLSECIERLMNHPSTRGAGNTVRLRLNRYPAVVVAYAGGIAALANERFENLAALISTPRVASLDGSFSSDLRPTHAIAASHAYSGQLVEGARDHSPASDHVFDAIRAGLRELIPDDESYDELFDLFEAIFSLGSGWFGRYAWNRKHDRRDRLTASVNGHSAELIEAGIFVSSDEIAIGVGNLTTITF